MKYHQISAKSGERIKKFYDEFIHLIVIKNRNNSNNKNKQLGSKKREKQCILY